MSFDVVDIPDDVPLMTDEEIIAASSRPSLGLDRWYNFQITGAKKGVWPSKKSFFIELTCAPINGDGVPQQNLAVKYNMTLPFRNPNEDGHQGSPRAIGPCHGFLTACGLVTDQPRKQDDGTWLGGDGTVYNNYSDVKAETVRLRKDDVQPQLREYFQDPNSLVGNTFVGYYTTDGSWGDKIKQVRPEVPDGEVVETEKLTG